MMCPHCKKPIRTKLEAKIFERAKELRNSGFSVRDISQILRDEGIFVSFATIARALKKGGSE